MGEAKARSRKAAEIISAEQRCIYCDQNPETVEHMPPRSIFGRGERPSGMEFGCCLVCNNASKASDAAAAFFSRLAPEHKVDEIELARAYQLVGTLAQQAPDAIREIFDPEKDELIWTRGRSNILGPMHRIELDGPIVVQLMTVFGAKLGMAAYREHVGQPLPLEGRVYTQHYFNAGLFREDVENTLSILPSIKQLEQGKKKSGIRFNYRFNTDEKSIFAGFFAFNNNLFFRVFSVSDPKFFKPLDEAHPNGAIQPGSIREMSKLWAPLPQTVNPDVKIS